MKAALLKEEEDQLLPHKRKRKPKEVENDGGQRCDTEEPQQKILKTDHSTEKIKKRPAQPPPLNFQELLKIAEKKQFEPIVIEKPKKEEDLPMMTKKEREKYLEEKKIEAMRAARRQGKCLPMAEKPKEVKPVEKEQKPTVSNSKIDINAENKLKKKPSVWSKDLQISKELNNNHSKNDKYIPRPTNGSEGVRVKSYDPANRSLSKYPSEKQSSNEKRYSSNDERYSPKPKSVNDKYIPKTQNSVADKYSPTPKHLLNNEKYVPKSSSASSDKYSPKLKSSMACDRYSPKPKSSTERYVPKPKTADEKYSPKPKSTVQPEKYVPKGKSLPSVEKYTPSAIKRKDEKYSPKPVLSSSVKSKPTDSKDKYVPMSIDKSKKLPSNSSIKSKQFPPKDLAPKQFPPRDMVPKQFPPRDLAPRQFPPPDMMKRNNHHAPMRNKRQIIESDSEYDSELDDFIDDGPEDGEDYSKVISEIFRYDKSK